MSELSKAREPKYDLLRIIAILGTFFVHVPLADLKQWQYYTLIKIFLSLTPLFFLVSGALVLPTKGSRKWLRHRLGTLLPAFVVWSVIYLLMKIHFDAELTPEQLKYQMFWFLFYPTFRPGYFIYAMIGLYVVSVVVSPWLRTATRRSVEVLLVLWLLSSFYIYAGLYVDVVQPWESLVGQFYGFFGYMLAGYYFTRYKIRNEKLGRQLLTWGGLIAVGIVGSCRYWVTANRYGFEDVVSDWLTPNAIAWFVLVFVLVDRLDHIPDVLGRLITWIGRRVYGMFLVHYFVIKYMIEMPDFMPGCSFMHPATWWQAIIVTFVISLAVTAVLSYLPFSRWTVGIGRR